MKRYFFYILLIVLIRPNVLFSQNQTIIDSLKSILPELSNERKLDILIELSKEYSENSPDSFETYALRANKLATELNNKTKIVETLLLLANQNTDVNNYGKAMELSLKALDISESIKDSKLIVRSYMIIGIIHYYTGNLDAAINSMKRAISIADSIKFVYPWLINNYAAFLQEKGKYKEALDSYFRTLKLVKKTKDSADIGLVLSNIGELYTQMGDYDNAIIYSEKGLRLESKYSTNYQVTSAYLTVGSLYLKLKKYKKAKKLFNRGFKLANKIKSVVHLIGFNKAYSELYKLKGNYKLSLKYLSRYIELKDSLAENENQKTSDKLKSYETQKKDNKINLLGKEKEIQTLYRNISIGGFIFAFILAVGLFNRYRFKTKANRELSLAREKADEANQLKTELLGIAAHDLKNPLNSIVGFSRLLKKKIPDNSTEKEFISTIEESSENMLNLINKLLNSSAIETGKLDINLSPVDFNQLTKEIVENYSSVAGLKKQTVTSRILDKTLVVNADHGKLREVLANLISNALKYSDYGKNIKINLREENNNAVFEVIDEGPGLTEEDKKKIFGKFQKLSAKPTGGESSTGLGLSIAKQLIELQKGKISVESEFGKGSKFIVTLPLIDAEKVIQNEKEKQENHKTMEAIEFEPATIIIADDISENRQLIKEIISDYGFTIFEVKNGRELVELSEKVKPELIFTDIKMPEMDGFEALKIIKQNSELADIPVIAVTAEDKEKVMEFDFDNCLNKPVEEEKVLKILSSKLKTKETKIEKKESIDLPADTKSYTEELKDKELLLVKLNSEYQKESERLQTTLIIDEIESFSENLKKLANEHNAYSLDKYAGDLLKSCQAFNIPEIKKSLKSFTEIVKLISNPQDN